MQPYTDVLFSSTGPVRNVSVTVKTSPGGAVATIYSDNGVTPAANPLTTGNDGRFLFYAADGFYTITVSGAGITTQTIGPILLQDYSTTTPVASKLAASSGSSLVGDIGSDVGAVARTEQSKNRDFISLKGFGTTGDGVTNDTVGINAANALGKAIYQPRGTYLGTTVVDTTLVGPYWGFDGQIKDSGGNLRGKFFSALSSAPASFGAAGSISTAFNGDISKQIFSIESRIVGADTLGTVAQIGTDGFRQKPEASPFFIYMRNASGRTDNVGNGTGIPAIFCTVDNASANGGNTSCFVGNANITAARSPTGAYDRTSVTCFTGQTSTDVANGYLNTLEFLTSDRGFDSAAAGLVLRFNRTNATGANNGFWIGTLLRSSEGTQPVDYGILYNGPFTYGIDFTQATLTSGQAITLKADQRIYFNATAGTLPKGASSAGTSYIAYNNAASKIIITVAGVNTAQFDNAGFIYMPSGGGVAVNGVQVLTNRRTGWTAPTGTLSRAAFDQSTVTLAVLAQHVAALIVDLGITSGMGILDA